VIIPETHDQNHALCKTGPHARHTAVFGEHGGMAGMGAGLAEGMVLVMSLWDDHAANMLWLDRTT
jgi:hypothetical protein